MKGCLLFILVGTAQCLGNPVVQACSDDRQKFCGKHTSDAAINACLTASRAQLSSVCATALDTHDMCKSKATDIIDMAGCPTDTAHQKQGFLCLKEKSHLLPKSCAYLVSPGGDGGGGQRPAARPTHNNNNNTHNHTKHEHTKKTHHTPREMEYTEELYAMCSQCLWNTLDTTLMPKADGSMFVITGDIADMWIRDSSAQVHPYVFLAKNDTKLRKVVEGTAKAQAFNIIQSPYSNSYNIRDRPKSDFNAKELGLGRGGYAATHNYEMDSGCYYFRLLHEIWTIAEGASFLKDEQEILSKAAHAIVDLWQLEQHHEEDSPYRYPELSREGLGSKTTFTGLSWTGFRPSDDPCTFHYLIPSNLFGIKTLMELQAIASAVWGDKDLVAKAKALEADIRKGVQQHGIHEHPTFGRVYCYEVDGLGGCNLMDDANVPSLLSLPYLDPRAVSYDAEIYQNTRKLVLSAKNKFFFEGSKASGIGSPHTPKGYIWPMAIIMQAMTSTDTTERLALVQTLVDTTGGTRFMHESFNKDNPSQFTRPWFAWVNSLFAELMFRVTGEWCTERVAGADPTAGGSFKSRWGSGVTYYSTLSEGTKP